MPMTGHLNKTRIKPRKKTAVPTILSVEPKKNFNVLMTPIIEHIPARKRTLPSVKSEVSKRNTTPMNMKRMPKAVRPIPIFLSSLNIVANGLGGDWILEGYPPSQPPNNFFVSCSFPKTATQKRNVVKELEELVSRALWDVCGGRESGWWWRRRRY
mmetsp:Transcript_31442/g.76720  ORF Transcript_31442/g.76720 Transcript_31442/m.76720 type:complete len:156 (+) Transcript_31442:545-1012(+)